MSEDEVAEPLKKFLALEKETKAFLTETNQFLKERTVASKDNAEHLEKIKALQARIKERTDEMAKSRKAAAEHEGKFLAKNILEEVEEKLGTLAGELQTAT